MRRSPSRNVRRIVADVEVLFTRSGSIARRIEGLIRQATASIDCALYRLEHPALANALDEAAARGVAVRLVLDRGKLREGHSAIRLEEPGRAAVRISSGPYGGKSKMHHKFAVVDGKIALSGSYNWTVESESGNFENLVILRAPAVVSAYCQEFESLWAQSDCNSIQV
ncbi:MAG: phospholipase D-like domain-containing protein [Terriglobia bacterium]